MLVIYRNLELPNCGNGQRARISPMIPSLALEERVTPLEPARIYKLEVVKHAAVQVYLTLQISHLERIVLARITAMN
jgi:hypothetical protein